jgi:hypothetical protein
MPQPKRSDLVPPNEATKLVGTTPVGGGKNILCDAHREIEPAIAQDVQAS